MPNVDKIIEKMQNQPKGIRPEEAGKVRAAFGYEMRKQTGSHRIYKNRKNGKLLSIPQANPIDKAYVEQILQNIVVKGGK
jgi:predicted RNA binding protein YcfA (HicA-like mRNA interferase family)